MLKVRDPLGLMETNPKLKARIAFFEKVMKPACFMIISLSVLFMVVVFVFEMIKHG